MSSYRNYYDSTFGRPSSTSKPLSEPRPSRIATKYGGSYTSSIASTKEGRTDPPRITHPPLSYKPLVRTTPRSREVSPSVDKSEKSSSTSSSYLNPNRLYPRPYTRSSTSRESTVSPASSTSNLPRLTAKRDAVTPGRTSSKEYDSSSSSQNKYLNSRFLPKNSVERSYTAYSRPSNIRTHEVSRKNKELLNALQVQQEQRSSSKTPETPPKVKEPSPVKQLEMETVKVCTRGTSPTLTTPTPPTFLRSRRIEFAKTVEKTVTRPKTLPENMVDKEMQSDRLDDSTRSSRFAGATRITATPWTNILDMKFTSPGSKKDSPKSLSRTSSTKSLTSSKSKLTPPKPVDKKLPPPIPKLVNTPNKDFRKSVLNMNPDGTRKKVGRRSNSASSAESDNADPDATDVSENLTSCSYHSKTRRSPSSEVSTSEEDSKKQEVEAKNFLMRALAPVTNLFKPKASDSTEKVVWILDSSSEEQSQPRSATLVLHRVESDQNTWWGDDPKPPEIYSGYNAENNMGGPRIKSVESGEAPWWLNQNSTPPDEVPEEGKPRIKPVESGEAPWWLNQNSTPPDEVPEEGKPRIKPVESGEAPWWLNQNSTPPEGVEIHPEPTTKPRIKPVESGEAPWWLNQDVTPPEGVEIHPKRNDSGTSTWWLDSEKSTSEPYKVETHQLRHIDSGEREWWLNDAEEEEPQPKKYPIRHQESGEKAWWMQDQEPLGDRASPEGLEMPKEGRLSPYDNVPTLVNNDKSEAPKLFISKHTNIDDILGGTGQLWSPTMNKMFGYADGDECREVDAREVIIHEGSGGGGTRRAATSRNGLDDAALQLYKDGDYGAYLDLEASISEQQEEFEGFQSNKKNSIVLRTQLSVRVHTIIEKLLTSEGRELRRALFSLKQIFQEDKDLVHEFVQNDGLSCLIKVGSEADQNYQNYILRALGQVMLYVDGMNGVMEHNQTIQWLYSLISSKFRLVVKTALKLLLVFVEYTDSNCMLLVKAIHSVDYSQGLSPYHNIMKLLKDFDAADTELLIYATTLVNKILNGVPDQDTYYDQVDALEEQGFESIVQRYMSKPGTDLDLLQQFQIYEAVLQYEDGEEKGGTPLRHLDEKLKKTLKSRRSMVTTTDRRKSRRHSTGTTPTYGGFTPKHHQEEYDESSSSSDVNNSQLNGSYKESNKANEAGVTPALKRRRERAERQRSFMREQQETAALLKGVVVQQNNDDTSNIENFNNGHFTNSLQQRLTNGNNLNRKDLTPFLNAVNRLESEEKPWIMDGLDESDLTNENDRNILMQLKKENTVKDLTQKLANQSMLQSPTEEKPNRFGDMCGLISKAKEGLAKSKSKADVLRSPTTENCPKIEPKKSENELRWEELIASLNRPLNLCDMDFTDLVTDDEVDVLAPATPINGIPPPPPPLQGIGAPPPPPPTSRIPTAPPPVPNAPLFGGSLKSSKNSTETRIPIKKNKKTVKLFWKEVRDDPISQAKLKSGYIWDELTAVTVDTQKLEHLFESRAKDLISKKQQELNKNKEIIVLDPKRSNAINIGMTKLPPPRSIKTAILKMDATIMNREGIEKLLTMLPTEEERTKIQDAQAANPDLPLGSAEQFLLTLASISELPARLKLWAFKLDFENSEREIAEPLMDLKQGFEVLRVNKTFRAILSTLLSIGIFLNGNEVKGFQIEYLTKVPEVKDTVHKHSLLHHLCHIVMEKFPEASDLYSEIGAITRASKVDFDELSLNIQRLESDCKASWDHLKLIAKHDGSTMMKVKMSDFLADCAERIILLGIIHRRIMNRFHKFLLWLGIPFHQVSDTKPNEFCRIISEFALEYRTTRERVLQQLEKKANHRERNKTRGKMITDSGKFRTKEDRADQELRQLLGSDISDVESMQGTLPWRHRRRENTSQNNTLGRNSTGLNGHLLDGDDEILESLVKTATKGPRTAPRERKRTRHTDRKSFKRSRTRENNPFGSRDSP